MEPTTVGSLWLENDLHENEIEFESHVGRSEKNVRVTSDGIHAEIHEIWMCRTSRCGAIPQYLWHNIEKFKQQIIHLLWWIKQVDMCKGLGEKLFFTFLHQICFDRGFKWKVAKFHVTDRTNIFLYNFFIFRLFHA